MLNLNYPLKLLCLYLAMHMNATDQCICTLEFIFNLKSYRSAYKTPPEIINLYLDGHLSNAERPVLLILVCFIPEFLKYNTTLELCKLIFSFYACPIQAGFPKITCKCQA